MRYDRIALAMLQARFLGSGFASDVPGGITAFLKTDAALPAPNIQLLFTAAPLGVEPWCFKPFADGFACRIVLLPPPPRSRGRITLADSNPAGKVILQSNFLARENDWKAMRRGIELVRDVASQPALGPFIDAETAPGDGDVDDHIRSTAITVHHPLGTCSMGRDGDPAAVVDQTLEVHGTTGLRVVDASVMSRLVSGNINAAVVAVAERAADLILGKPPLAPAVEVVADGEAHPVGLIP